MKNELSLPLPVVLNGRAAARHPGILAVRLPALLMIAATPLLLPSEHWASVERTTATYAVLALGYAVVLGLCGQFTVAHAALYGVGAYTSGILATVGRIDPWWTLPIAMVAAAVAGAIVGLMALRVRGDRLAVGTLAVGQLAQIVMLAWTPVTGGYAGISDIPPLSIAGHPLIDEHSLAIVAVVTTIAALFAFVRLRDSRMGLAFQAIREDEVLAASAGVRIGVHKVAAFAISGIFAGAAGWLEATAIGEVSPTAFDVVFAVLIAAMVLIAGAGRSYAVLAAAAFVAVTQDALAGFPALEVGVVGALIVLIVLLRSGALPLRRIQRAAGP